MNGYNVLTLVIIKFYQLLGLLHVAHLFMVGLHAGAHVIAAVYHLEIVKCSLKHL
jgi:hypothetical protein